MHARSVKVLSIVVVMRLLFQFKTPVPFKDDIKTAASAATDVGHLLTRKSNFPGSADTDFPRS